MASTVSVSSETFSVQVSLNTAMFFWAILEFSKPAVVDTMRLIVEGDNIPILILCAHGKDRTGMIVAIILACLEVDDEIIALDYAQSEVRKLHA